MRFDCCASIGARRLVSLGWRDPIRSLQLDRRDLIDAIRPMRSDRHDPIRQFNSCVLAARIAARTSVRTRRANARETEPTIFAIRVRTVPIAAPPFSQVKFHRRNMPHPHM
jgi:hypothetical protein